ncbi:MAG: gamma-glutamyltransferase, partial [Psychroserpens sp.]|nr:gamma-glutamyltransferase [Psychroserpens sp.]
MRYLIFCILCVLFFSCKKEVAKYPETISKRGVITQNAMVVTARKEASKIGSEILKQGGNAFDAMFATEMALAVVYPYAGNLGGGGFMVYRLSNGDFGALDYREKAPLNAYKDMYLDDEGNVIKDKSTTGVFSVGVPGTIAGIFEAHERFGSLPVSTLLQPVIQLAENGFVVTKKQHLKFQEYDSIITAVNGKPVFINNSTKPGDTLRNLALAQTLQRISEHGKEEFYQGETAQKLVDFIQKRNGIISMED